MRYRSAVRIMTMAALVLLGLSVSPRALADAEPKHPGVSGLAGVVLEPQARWRQGCGVGKSTDRWSVESLESGAMRFTVLEPGRASVWNFPARLGLSPDRTPILSMTYRATGLREAEGDRSVIVFYGGKPSNVTVVRQRDLVGDGREHTLRVDLREEGRANKPLAEAMAYVDLRVHAGDTPAEFDLIDLRFEAGETSDAPPAEAKAPVRVRVVGPAGAPIAGATVTLDPHLKHGKVPVSTDADGRAVLTPTAGEATRRALTAAYDGMTSLVFRDLSEVSGDTTLTATLYPTATYGGELVNPEGEPIAGAVGELWIDGIDRPAGPGRPQMDRSRRRVVTDDAGRWVSPPLPDTANVTVKVRWMHDDYLADRWGGQFSGTLAMADLRDGTARSVMPRGVAVSGRVYDKDGRPLADAQVAQGDDRFPSNAPPATTTDAEGRFHFAHTEPGRLVLTVTAEGHAPQLHQATAADGLEPIEFRLEDSAAFRFRVVDAEGSPIAGAHVCPDTWKGFRTIPGRVRTDERGEATWHGPHDPVEFDIFARGHRDNRGITFSPTAGEDDVHVVTLGTPLKVTATVTDADTGEPVTDFTPVMGILWQNDGRQSPHYERGHNFPTTHAGGKWEQAFSHSYPFRVVRIEADGYAPVTSEPIAEDAGHVELNFALRRAASLRGTVVDAAGRPVSGASIYLTTGSSNLYIRNGRVDRNRQHPGDITDARGGFVFPPQDDGFLLVILHDRGYAEVDGTRWAESGGQVTLQPWSRITGRLVVGDQPGAGEQVAISMHPRHDENPRPPYHDIKATVDADGHFTLDRVPPGRGQVARYLQISERSWTYARAENFDLAPGESLDVQIGGGGRPVTGYFVWPEDAANPSFAAGHHSLSTHVEVDPQAKQALIEKLKDEWLPADFDELSMEDRQAFMNSDKGRAAQKGIEEAMEAFRGGPRRHYSFGLEADGTFRIDNVPPGTYNLSLSLREPPVGNQCGMGEPIGSFSQVVTVPPLPDGVDYLAEPLDLGELTVTPVRPALRVGDAVPGFTLPVLPPAVSEDGAEIDLAALPTFDSADLAGKLTLVYFGASWCGPCHAEAPHLVKTHETFGEYPGFRMLNISLDQTPAAAVRYAEEKGYVWPQLYPTGAFEAEVVQAFGVRGIPSIWLVGPDGKVLAKDLRGGAILPAVKNAMPTAATTAAR
ncbi:MAG: carboxypeptidase regulatory-like domain-containing protein [Planctomycetota bacterium]